MRVATNDGIGRNCGGELESVDADDANAAKEAGAAFVHKGASPDELIATLTPLLRKENEGAEGG